MRPHGWPKDINTHRNARRGQSGAHFVRFPEFLLEENGAAESWENRLEAERS